MSANARRAIVFASITFASCLAMWMTENTNYLWIIIVSVFLI